MIHDAWRLERMLDAQTRRGQAGGSVAPYSIPVISSPGPIAIGRRLGRLGCDVLMRCSLMAAEI